MAKKKSFSQKINRSRSDRKFIDKENKVLGDQGFYGGNLKEPIPTYDKADCETVLHGVNNAYIVLGRDRSHNKKSIGFTQAGAIDIVAGRMSSYQAVLSKDKGPPDNNILVGPNMFADAARVYITQKGNVDSYFGLARGTEVTGEARNKSGVVVKADHVRLVGRNHIKIVTGRAQNTKPERNSLGGEISRTGRIDLIAGNYTEDESPFGLKWLSKKSRSGVKKLQPIPKGNNLEQLLKEIMDRLSDLSSITMTNTTNISTLGSYLAGHFHEAVVGAGILGVGAALPSVIGPAGAAISIPVKNIKTMFDHSLFNMQIGLMHLNYLQPAFSPKYINSRHVHTT